MTTFQDGPAKGVTLMLKRSPFFLRAVQAQDGKWDGLDQPEDEPRAGEVCYAYEMSELPRMCHIRAAKPAASGFWPVQSYRLAEPQPDPVQMRTRREWELWTEAPINDAAKARWAAMAKALQEGKP